MSFSALRSAPLPPEMAAAMCRLVTSDIAALDPQHLFDSGIREVDVSTATAAPAAVLFAVRDLCGAGLTVTWLAGAWCEVASWRLHHLSPPVPGSIADIAHLEWTAAHVYGSCYFRRGPGVVFVLDRRSRDASRYVLRGASRDLFLRLLSPVSVQDLTPVERASVRDFVECGLVIDLEGDLLALPYAMNRWPFPCNAI